MKAAEIGLKELQENKSKVTCVQYPNFVETVLCRDGDDCPNFRRYIKREKCGCFRSSGQSAIYNKSIEICGKCNE